MSGNRRKKTGKVDVETVVEAPLAARVVAMPKPAEATAAKAETPIDSKPAKPKSDRIGDILRHARKERGDDLYLIAEYLCIKPAFLVALENSRYDEFPADAYIIGFLRTYANFLGIDGKDAVDRYRYEMAGRRKKPVLSMPIPLTEGRAPSGILMVGATVAVLLIYALWYGISSANRTAVNEPPPLPPAQQIIPPAVSPAPDNAPASATSAIPPASPGIVVTAGQPPAAEAETKAILPAKDSKPAPDAKDGKSPVYGDPDQAAHVIIRASQSTWVLVNDADGKPVFDHVLKAGEIYKVPNRPGLTLTTGNGNGITLSVDGVDMPKVSTGAPHVVRDISLDPSDLRQPK